MYFTGNDSYQSFLVFAPMISYLILHSNIKVINWIQSEISSEKIKPFYTDLEPTMSQLAKIRVNLEF